MHPCFSWFTIQNVYLNYLGSCFYTVFYGHISVMSVPYLHLSFYCKIKQVPLTCNIWFVIIFIRHPNNGHLILFHLLISFYWLKYALYFISTEIYLEKMPLLFLVALCPHITIKMSLYLVLNSDAHERNPYNISIRNDFKNINLHRFNFDQLFFVLLIVIIICIKKFKHFIVFDVRSGVNGQKLLYLPAALIKNLSRKICLLGGF